MSSSTSDVFNVKVNDIAFTVPKTSIAGGNASQITIPYVINGSIIGAVQDVANGKKLKLSSNVDAIEKGRSLFINARNATNSDDDLGIYSHYGSFMVIKICQLIGIRKSMYENAFEDWTTQDQWGKLRRVEYLYLQYKLLDISVNWNKFFRDYDYPYTALLTSLQLSEVTSNPELYVEIVSFFENFHIAGIFTTSDDSTQARLLQLQKQKEDIDSYFLINPHDKIFENYLRPVKDTETKTWSCPRLAAINKRAPDTSSNVVSTLEEFQRRFTEFTCGVFEKSPNPDLPPSTTFPWKNVVVAGGSVMQMIEASYYPKHSSDVDIFIYGQSHKQNTMTFKAVRDWFKGPKTYFGVRGSVVYVYIVDINRTFQIICASNKTPYSVISRFDSSHIQWLYYDATVNPKELVFRDYELDNPAITKIMPKYSGMCVFGTQASMKTIRTRIAVLNNLARIKTERIVKTFIACYDIQVNETVANDIVDVGQIIKNENNPTVIDIVNELHAYWYPTTEASRTMSPETRERWIRGMIKLHSKATIVTQNPEEVETKVIINGNFDTDYDAMMFDNFQINSVRFIGARRNFHVPIKNIGGTIYLLSSWFTVSAITTNEHDKVITIKITDPKFISFINDIVSVNLLRIYTQMELTTPILSADNTLELTLFADKIAYQFKRGISMLKGSNGSVLNIDEDLRVGDKCRMIFSMEVSVSQESRIISILPSKLIKEVNINATDAVDELVEHNSAVAVTPVAPSEQPEQKELQFE